MLSRRFGLIVITVIILFGGTFVSPTVPVNYSNNQEISPDLTSGSIKGINWTYGLRQFTASGNITREDNGTLFEFQNDTRTTVRDVSLITDFNVTEIIWGMQWNSTFTNNTDTFPDTIANFSRYNNKMLELLILHLNYTIALRFDPVLSTGQALLDLQVIENYTTVISSVVSTRGKFLAEFPSNTTFVEYNHKFVNGTVIRRSGILSQEIIIAKLTTQVQTVKIKHTKISFAWMAYYVRYSTAYNVSAKAYIVNITNGRNFGLQVTMFDEIEANYTEVVITWAAYEFRSFDWYELTYMNGSPVDWGMYPRHMLPVSYNSSGIVVEGGWRHISSKLISTFQSVIAAFAQVSVNTSAMALDATSIEAKLAVWGLQSSTTMVAFDDGNENGRLDLSLGDDGLNVDPADRVAYLGLGEAYQTTVINANFRSHEYNESAEFHGLGVTIENNNVNETISNEKTVSFGFGNPYSPTTTNFNWVDPVEDTDGSVVFDFGVDYVNFPVTWVNMTDPKQSFIDPTNISYNYKVRVNPDTGRAKISPTWKFGGIGDPGAKAAMDQLSLALIVKSEFFALQATYTATESNATVNSSRASAFSRIAISTGGGNATEIDVTGPKQNYTLSSTSTYQANFDVINLLQVSGHFSGEQVSPFESESENTGGTASVGSVVETLTVDFFYTANLVIISYPVWNGADIIHDPDYNVNYEPIPQVTTPSTDVTSTTTDTGISSTSDTGISSTTDTPTLDTSTSTSEADPTTTKSTASPESKSESPGVPGFTVVITIAGLILIPIIRKKH